LPRRLGLVRVFQRDNNNTPLIGLICPGFVQLFYSFYHKIHNIKPIKFEHIRPFSAVSDL